MKILCIRDKCILYPVCVAKEDIECDLLYSFITRENQRELHGNYKRYARFWKRVIINALPNLKRVRREDGRTFYQIPHDFR